MNHGREDYHCCLNIPCLMQIQVNALLLLLDRHTPGVPIKEEFQQLISEGVQTVGLETMEGIKNRIYEGIVQQEQGESGMVIIDLALILYLTSYELFVCLDPVICLVTP